MFVILRISHISLVAKPKYILFIDFTFYSEFKG